MRKVVGGFGINSCASTGLRKPGNARNLAVKMAIHFKTKQKFHVIRSDCIKTGSRLVNLTEMEMSFSSLNCRS